MFKIILILVVVLIAGVLIFAGTRPDTFRVERHIDIQASPEKIFPLVNDLHRFSSWSPYEHKDPAMKRTYSGAAEGVGSIYAWDGNKEVGQGSMEITGSSASSVVTIKLEFIRPFAAVNTAEFTLQPQGQSTRVTWAMFGPSPFISKLMCLFFNMDKMVGTDFESGLVKLKSIAES